MSSNEEIRRQLLQDIDNGLHSRFEWDDIIEYPPMSGKRYTYREFYSLVYSGEIFKESKNSKDESYLYYAELNK